MKKKTRLGLLVLAGTIFVAGVAVYRHYCLGAPPVGKGPAGPKVDRAAFEKPWTTRKVLLLGLGDSITDGFGVPYSKSYFARLYENPDDEFADVRGICLRAVLPNLTQQNLSVSGSTSLDHIEHIREKLDVQPADVFALVVMTTGGNDLIHNYGRTPPREGAMYGATLEQAGPWIANFEKRLDTMIELIEERFAGGCAIFLADIYDPTDGVGDAPTAGLPDWPDAMKLLSAYNRIIHRCAERRESVHLVPMHAAFLGHGIHCREPWREHYRRDDPHYWYHRNLEDPNARGYDAIRRLFLNEMAKARSKLAKLSNDSPEEGNTNLH
jgi:lysophospholipase L1-like esterase